jgi:hypothetical protein
MGPQGKRVEEFKTRLRELPWRWVLFWLLVPNLLIILMWPIGGPPMQPALLMFGLAALVVSSLPWVMAKRVALLAMIAVATSSYVCSMFNISPTDVAILPTFLSEVRPWQSPMYLFGTAIVLCAMGVSLWIAPRLPRLATARSFAFGLLAVLGLGQADHVATAATAGSYHATWLPGEPFVSATTETGIVTPPASRHNVVLILVEGLGLPTVAPERPMFDADWNRPRWGGRYIVARGRVPYYGSTTNGELRELCGVWGQYVSFDFANTRCLPETYRAAGYGATAMHSFYGSFFDRDKWWPKLGFERMKFKPQLLAEGARQCGGIFPGVCDQDVPQLIGRQLKAARRPQFIYWVTLNTHLPVIADPKLGTSHCEFADPAWQENDPQLCRMFMLHHRLTDAIDKLVMDPNLPPTDFVIVGDHMPPFLGRQGRFRFDPAHVPYLYLRSKGTAGKPVT